jgi:hypothetical protein
MAKWKLKEKLFRRRKLSRQVSDEAATAVAPSRPSLSSKKRVAADDTVDDRIAKRSRLRNHTAESSTTISRADRRATVVPIGSIDNATADANDAVIAPSKQKISVKQARKAGVSANWMQVEPAGAFVLK